MSTELIIVVCIFVVALTIGLYIFLDLMNKQNKKKLSVDTENNCLKHIEERYDIWYSSFVAWTIINYGLNLLDVMLSLSTVFFAAKNMMSGGALYIDNYVVIAFSLLAALITTSIYFLEPKEHLKAFYRASVTIEHGILKYKLGLISIDQLLDILIIAENYSMQ